jgi:hypothetical protein
MIPYFARRQKLACSDTIRAVIAWFRVSLRTCLSLSAPEPQEEDDMNVIGIERALGLVAALLGVAGMGVAHADPVSFKVPLTGAQCVPAVDTSGSGSAEITFDPTTRAVTWTIAFSGLSSPATMAHFHGPAKQGQNGPVVVWLSSQGTPPANPITGHATLTPDQAKQFSAGDWYVNVHTQSHPACEIRGYVAPPKG